MRILVLGGDGMLGHQLVRSLAPRHEVRVTLHGPLARYAAFGLFTAAASFPDLDVRDFASVRAIVAAFAPQAIINAVGIVKQQDAAKLAIPSIEINALLPHRLAELSAAVGARFIQISTDCVFSGRRGHYREDDEPDPIDLYGRSKLLGEVSAPNCLTLRTSIVGPELSRKQGLLEWFLAQRGPVRGFTKAIFSGLTTLELSRVIERILLALPQLCGLYHVSSAPIDKAGLLALFQQALHPDCAIVPDDSFVIDRSLDSTRFRQAASYQPPSWPQMIADMAASMTDRPPPAQHSERP